MSKISSIINSRPGILNRASLNRGTLTSPGKLFSSTNVTLPSCDLSIKLNSLTTKQNKVISEVQGYKSLGILLLPNLCYKVCVFLLLTVVEPNYIQPIATNVMKAISQSGVKASHDKHGKGIKKEQYSICDSRCLEQVA